MTFAIPDHDFGTRVERRLRDDVVAWLTTVRRDGLPQPSPIWFLWDGDTVLVYSRPETQKLRNIAHSPLVSLNLDGDGRGGDIVVLSGEAEIRPDDPPADRVPDYVAKYDAGFRRIGMTAVTFAQSYSVPI